MTSGTVDRLQLDARVAATDRYDWWEQCLTDAIYPVVVEPVGVAASRFQARFTAARVGAVSLSQGVVDPVGATITRRAAHQAPPDAIQFTVSARHRRQLLVDDDWTSIPAGALVVHDATVACTHRAEDRDSLTMITVPRAALSVDERRLRELMLRPLTLDPASRRVLAGAAAAVLDPAGRFPAAAAESYLAGAADLVLRAVGGQDPDHADTAQVRRQQALDHVRAHLADPDLSLTEVAAALRISPRRLQQLFHDEGGLTHLVRRLRIERAVVLLADPASARLSTARIAARCGFQDRSAFSRACLAVSGRRPSEWRTTGDGSA